VLRGDEEHIMFPFSRNLDRRHETMAARTLHRRL
jgi:hypothetical protein